MAAAVLCLAVGLLSFVGLTVASLRFTVNPASSQVAACLRTIGLAPKAAAADAEPQTAEAAADLHQKQKNDLRPCKPSEAMVKIRWFVELPIACGALLKARSYRFGLSFIPSKKPIGGLGRDRRRINFLLCEWQTAGQNPEYLIGGSYF